MRNKLRKIKNGNVYPLELHNAVVEAYKTVVTKSARTIASDYNISESTVHRWAGIARVQRGTRQNLTAANKAHWAKTAAEKAWETPTINIDGTITLRGQIYR